MTPCKGEVDISQCESKHLYRKTLSACPHCDLVIKRHEMGFNQYSVCPRCHSKVEHVQFCCPTFLRLTVFAALLFYIPANFFPLVSVEIAGQLKQTSVFDGIWLLVEQDQVVTAAIVLFCSLIVPSFIIVTFVVLLVSMRFGIWRRLQRGCVRLLVHLRDWSMLDIYLISFLVTMFKVKDMGELHLQIGLAAFIGLTIAINKLFIMYDRRALWRLITD